MTIRCALFGHRPAFGYGRIEGEGYFEIRSIVTDGIGRRHASLYTHCERCGKHFKVGMVHLPNEIEKKMEINLSQLYIDTTVKM